MGRNMGYDSSQSLDDKTPRHAGESTPQRKTRVVMTPGVDRFNPTRHLAAYHLAAL
jgi:hypothetical protein